MKVTIHQPNFLPYLGFFDKADFADILVLYDSAQFVKGEFHNRNRVRVKEGWFWLTIPIAHNHPLPIDQVGIDNSKPWKRNHLESLKMNYSGSKFYNHYFSAIKDIYNKTWNSLSDFNIALIDFFIENLRLSCKVIRSSDLEIKTKSTLALVDICKKLGADTYISGSGGRGYIEEVLFKEANINLVFQNYSHPLYKQRFKGFQPYMASLDLLFNHGPSSLEIIRSGRYYSTE